MASCLSHGPSSLLFIWEGGEYDIVSYRRYDEERKGEEISLLHSSFSSSIREQLLLLIPPPSKMMMIVVLRHDQIIIPAS